MPQIIVSGQTQEDNEKEKQLVYDTIHKTAHEGLANHNQMFLNTFRNVMMEAFYGAPVDQVGPSYFNLTSSATGANKEPMESLMTPGATKAATTQPLPVQPTAHASSAQQPPVQ